VSNTRSLPAWFGCMPALLPVSKNACKPLCRKFFIIRCIVYR